MREYVYPKVPHYYHDSVSSEVFDADDLIIMEKLDGSNCKICMYDERYSDLYGDSILTHDPADGDVFISSKKVVRGRLSDQIAEFDNAFGRLVAELRDRLDLTVLRELHNEYQSPLVLFGEHMVKHTLDYGYGESPPPAFLGFDVLQLTEHREPPANPFEERFTGFLPIGETDSVFNRLNLEQVPIVPTPDDPITDPESVEIPVSEYSNVQAEGVVFRSDVLDRRVKYVSPEFRERAQEAWGLHESDAESGVELFSARYLTNARIRKTVNKLLHQHDESSISSERVATAAVADAWEEELSDIRSIGIPITPLDVFPEAKTRADAIIETMRTNASLNNTTIGGLWNEYQTPGENSTNETEIPGFDTVTVESNQVESKLRSAESSIENELVHIFISEQNIHDVAEALAEEHGEPIGRWVIIPTSDELEDRLWLDNLDVIAQLPVAFIPNDVSEILLEFVIRTIEERDDVTIDEKPEDWKPNIDEAETAGLGNLF